MATARELGFRVNRAASELRRRKSNNIGVLLPSPRNFFYGEMVTELHWAIRQAGFAPIFAFWDNLQEQEDALESILMWQMEAIITVEPSLLPGNIDIPVVSFGNAEPRFDAVGLNLDNATHLILKYLHDLGHRSAAWLGNIMDKRTELFRQNAAQYDMSIPEEFQIQKKVVLSFDDGREFFDQLLCQSGGKLPTAIIAHNDMLAIGIISRAVELGYRIPDDFSIIGQDNIAQARVTIPPLTTIHYSDGNSIAEMLVQSVLERMNAPEAPRRIILLEPVLIERKSCGPVSFINERKKL